MNSVKTLDKAIAALDGMATIVRAGYVSQDIVKPQREKALCGGRQFCAIGSLWTGYGAKPRLDYGYWELEGSEDDEERETFLSRRPALKAAYDALNRAATSLHAQRPDLRLNESFSAPIEALFEQAPKRWRWRDADEPAPSQLTRSDLLKIIASAKRDIAKQRRAVSA